MVKVKKIGEVEPHSLTTIYGVPGSGKTSLIKTMQGRVLILDADNGLASIQQDMVADNRDVDVAEIETWEDVLDALDEAKNYDSIAIDHISKIQQLLYAYLIENDKKAKRMTLQLYGYAKEEMVILIDQLVRLANAGKSVLVISQEKQINLEEDEESDVPKLIAPDLQGGIRDYLLASCSLVANSRKYVRKVKVDGKLKKVVEYGLQFKDSNVYILKIRAEESTVPDYMVNPTWGELMELLGVKTSSGGAVEKPKKKAKKSVAKKKKDEE